MPEQNPLIQFVQRLIKEAGLDNMSEDFKAEYQEKLAQEVQKRLGLMAIKELDEKALGEFAELTERKPNLKPEETIDFFKTHIQDFESKMTKTLQEFGQEFATNTQKLRAAMGS